jgi:hypothetical protein
MENELWQPVEEEFDGADFGDERLTQRLMTLVKALDGAPQSSLARSSKTIAAREAAYRFVENERVGIDAMLAPHRAATVERCREAGVVYVVSDTTEFSFSGAVRGKGLGRTQGGGRGFLGHVAIAVSADGSRKPLGVLGINTILRSDTKVTDRSERQKQGLERESSKWGKLVEQVEVELNGVPAIHVMDREADIYELLSGMVSGRRRFVIRASQDRLLEGDEKLFGALPGAPVLLEREVKLSPRLKPRARAKGKGRGLPARHGRAARLTISCRRVTIRRPQRCESSHPESLELNVVHVYEPSPPADQVPVEWILVTSEPIETAQQAAAVVDAYRARWLIEEYFKALKSGCSYEARELRSVHTLTNMLGLLAVIAWRLLLLRALEREAPETPAAEVIDATLLEALAARLKHIKEPKPLPINPTVADVMKAIARLAGHHKSNGPPGWALLWHGLQDWLSYAAGFIAGKFHISCDHS